MDSGLMAVVSIAHAALPDATKPAPTTKLAPAATERDSSWRRVRPRPFGRWPVSGFVIVSSLSMTLVFRMAGGSS